MNLNNTINLFPDTEVSRLQSNQSKWKPDRVCSVDSSAQDVRFNTLNTLRYLYNIGTPIVSLGNTKKVVK